MPCALLLSHQCSCMSFSKLVPNLHQHREEENHLFFPIVKMQHYCKLYMLASAASSTTLSVRGVGSALVRRRAAIFQSHLLWKHNLSPSYLQQKYLYGTAGFLLWGQWSDRSYPFLKFRDKIRDLPTAA